MCKVQLNQPFIFYVGLIYIVMLGYAHWIHKIKVVFYA